MEVHSTLASHSDTLPPEKQSPKNIDPSKSGVSPAALTHQTSKPGNNKKRKVNPRNLPVHLKQENGTCVTQAVLTFKASTNPVNPILMTFYKKLKSSASV
jgi:hypothetical protein